MNKYLAIIVSVLALSLTGCDKTTSTLTGGALGSALGIGIGSVLGGTHGAIAGGVIGGLAGGAVGSAEAENHPEGHARTVVVEEVHCHDPYRDYEMDRMQHDMNRMEAKMHRDQRRMQSKINNQQRSMNRMARRRPVREVHVYDRGPCGVREEVYVESY